MGWTCWAAIALLALRGAPTFADDYCASTAVELAAAMTAAANDMGPSIAIRLVAGSFEGSYIYLANQDSPVPTDVSGGWSKGCNGRTNTPINACRRPCIHWTGSPWYDVTYRDSKCLASACGLL
jgi:hypothetical protein